MLILASASPRRHELLLAAGIDHKIMRADVSEERLPDEDPKTLVQRLAKDKADAVACSPDDTVLGADTVVCLEERVFGKPKDDQDAAQMLRLLSGRTHQVLTGICLRAGQKRMVAFAETSVSFCRMTVREIEDYVASGEPRDKAGAYAIQGLGSRFVESIRGSYHNVVGLPVSLVYQYLKTL